MLDGVGPLALRETREGPGTPQAGAWRKEG